MSNRTRVAVDDCGRLARTYETAIVRRRVGSDRGETPRVPANLGLRPPRRKIATESYTRHYVYITASIDIKIFCTQSLPRQVGPGAQGPSREEASSAATYFVDNFYIILLFYKRVGLEKSVKIS